MAHVIELSDCCDLDFSSRRTHYMDQLVRDDAPFAERDAADKQARAQATEEMLDEIHCMLRHLTKDAK